MVHIGFNAYKVLVLFSLFSDSKMAKICKIVTIMELRLAWLPFRIYCRQSVFL